MNQTFTVTGMTCGHCERAVKNAVQQLDPQAQVNIDRAANRVDIDSTPASYTHLTLPTILRP